jgi:polyferredoxin
MGCIASRVLSPPSGDLRGSCEPKLNLDWIDEALADPGMATIRRRRWPAEPVVWLAIVTCPFRGMSTRELMATIVRAASMTS